MRDAFGEALVKCGKAHDDIVVVDADIALPTRASFFQEEFPDRFVQMGINEQNAVSFASGLATCGYTPLVNLFASFASTRASDQVNISVAYPRLNVKIAGCYAGITTPNTGATHQSVFDIAVMRAMPNMTVIEPADGNECQTALEAAFQYVGPVYFRVARCPVPLVYEAPPEFEIGKASVLIQGTDVSIVAGGVMVSRCVEAARLLHERGISAEIINVSTLKPLDSGTLLSSAAKTGGVVTVENHSVIGGLGGAVSELLSENHPVPVRRVGIKDVHGSSGQIDDLFVKYGLTTEAVVTAASDICERKNNDTRTTPDGC